MTPSRPTRLLLIRHGETDDNRFEVFQGQAGHGLNDRGRRQAGLLAERLSRAGLALSALSTSDLQRAMETAALLNDTLMLHLRHDPALREVYLGGWQGLSRQEVASRFPDEWAAWEAGVDLRRGGGESLGDLALRMTTAIERIASAHEGEAVAIVSHGAALKVFAAKAVGAIPHKLHPFRVLGNTGLAVVERAPGEPFRLTLWGDDSHLGDTLCRALRLDAEGL